MPALATAAEFKARVVEIAGSESVFRRSALNIRDGGGVFERVLGSGQYPCVLEIGTYRGISAAFIAQFCDRVITIDLAHGRLEQLGETFDRHALWDRLGVADRIDLHLVADAAEKAEVIAGLAFDLAFIDGGKDDIADDFALVRHCGAVLFHDVSDRGQPALNAVHDFVHALPQHQVEHMDIFALWRGPRGRHG